jgi:hypothetical protein
MRRHAKVVVEPRAPVSSTDTFLNSAVMKVSILAAPPPFFSAAKAQAER